MYVYAIFRHGNRRFSDWHVYKLFNEKKDADAFVNSKNIKARTYTYAVKKIKVH